MEAFRVLANRGFIPELGPVEFHWYAAEEAGLYGSLDIAAYKKDQGAKVGAMMEFVSATTMSQVENRMLIKP
jgi:leucyl aminopeptidase